MFNSGIFTWNTNRGDSNCPGGLGRQRALPFAFCLMLSLVFVPRDSVLAQGLAPSGAASSALDSGYRQMYNLQFAEAHKTFAAWQQLNPGDPLGPTSHAAA